MSNSWIIRLPQDQASDDAILIRVTRKDGHDLDLDLLATDGDYAYQGKGTSRSKGLVMVYDANTVQCARET